MSTPVLVTGAAGGTQGATGRRVTELLLSRGVPVRAMVRTDDARAARLRELGADVVVGDLLDGPAVRRAMQGVGAVFFVYPVQPGLLEATANVGLAARDERVRLVVNLSQGSASPRSPSPTSRRHWMSERALESLGVRTFNLRGGVFYENVFRQFAAGLAADGELRAPFGDGHARLPLIAAEDVAHVAAAALTGRMPVARLTLPVYTEARSLHEIAALVSRVTGRSIRYRQISDEAWLDEARRREDPRNLDQLTHLDKLWHHILGSNRLGLFRLGVPRLPPVIRALTGHRGESLESWLRRHAERGEYGLSVPAPPAPPVTAAAVA